MISNRNDYVPISSGSGPISVDVKEARNRRARRAAAAKARRARRVGRSVGGAR